MQKFFETQINVPGLVYSTLHSAENLTRLTSRTLLVTHEWSISMHS